MTQKSKQKKVKHYIKTVMFLFVVIALVLYIMLEVFLPHQTVKVFGFKPYVVITGSMEPVIKVNDVVVVTRTNPQQLEIGDIITFAVDLNQDGNREVVTHYLYDVTKNSSGDTVYRTQAHFENPDDASPDPWLVSEEDILGAYAFKIPQLGLLIQFLQSPLGIMTMVVNFLVIGGIIAILKLEKSN